MDCRTYPLRCGRVSASQAIQWVHWAAERCGVPASTARPLQPPPTWSRTIFVPAMSRPLTVNAAKKYYAYANRPWRSMARAAHVKRCMVAYCMATVPYPTLDNRTASLSIIDFAMRWGGRLRAHRAVVQWENRLASGQPKSGE